jgi:hypothetical protein
MIVDNLTIAGIIAASAYLLMPVLMGRELIRVSEGEEDPPTAYKGHPRRLLELAESANRS